MQKYRTEIFPPARLAAGSSPAEFVVDAGADDVLVERNAGGITARRATPYRARLTAEVDVEILELGGPVRGNGGFDTGAGGPADLRRAVKGQGAGIGLQIAERTTGGAVEQDAVEGIAGAAARRGEPVALGCATETTIGVSRAVQVRPVAIAFDAEHELAPLIIAADGAADQEAISAEVPGRSNRRRRGPAAVAEAITAVDADIDAGQVKTGTQLPLL